MTQKEQREIVDWCVSRLVDNYEWADFMEYEDWLRIQDALSFAIMGASEARISQFVELCQEHGVIEEA